METIAIYIVQILFHLTPSIFGKEIQNILHDGSRMREGENIKSKLLQNIKFPVST